MLKLFGEYNTCCDTHGQQNGIEWRFYKERLLRHKVTSMIHLGVLNGGSEYNIAQTYHEEGIPCRIVAIDECICQRLIGTYHKIHKQFPKVDLELWTCDTKDMKIHEEFDAAFIDANHNYEFVKRDFELVRPFIKKMIGFHDVGFDINGPSHDGVSKFLCSIRHKYSFEEVKYHFDPWYGIGILYVPTNK